MTNCKRFLPSLRYGRNDRLSPETRTDEWRRRACFERSEKFLIAAAIHPFPLSIPVVRVIPPIGRNLILFTPSIHDSHFTFHN